MEHRGGVVDDTKPERPGLAGSPAIDTCQHRETPGGTPARKTRTASHPQATETAGENEKGSRGVSSASDRHDHRTRIFVNS